MASTHGHATDKPTGAYAGTSNGSDYRAEKITTSSAGSEHVSREKAERVRATERATTRTQPYGTTNDASIGTLISSLLSDTSRLVRDEVRLAKAEASEKVSQATDGAKNIAIGGGLLLLGGIFLLLAVMYALALIMPLWLAALLVGGVFAAIGYIMLKKGTDELKAKNLAPTRTQANIRRDANMVKESV